MVSQKQNEVLGPYASLLESTSTNMAGIEEDTSAGRELLNNDRGSRLTAAILPHQDRAILGSLEPTTVLSKQSDIAVQTAAPAVGDELESGRGTTLLYGTGNTLVQSSEVCYTPAVYILASNVLSPPCPMVHVIRTESPR